MSSWRIGSLLGFPLKIHITFPLVFVWSLMQFGGLHDMRRALFGLLLTLLLFVCVLLHELGHAVVAHRLGAVVEDITLLPIGGVARFRSLSERPRDELLIALAGPLVNLALALLLVPLIALANDAGRWHLLGSEHGTSRLATFLLLALHAIGQMSLAGMAAYLFLTNLMLALFNLLPAFPLDGGRVLRAVLAAFLSFPTATTVAVRFGQLIAILLIVWGIRVDGTLAFVGIFMLMGGGSELRRAAMRRTLERGTVGGFMSRPADILPPDMTVAQAHQAMTLSGWSALPVAANNRVVGLLHMNDLRKQPLNDPISAVMGPMSPVLAIGQSLYDAQLALHHAERFVGAVLEGDNFLGLITQADIDRGYHRLVEAKRLGA